MKMFYENLAKAKSDPMGALRSTGQAMQDNNAMISQFAVLAYYANHVNQQLAENTGFAVMPAATSAISSFFMLSALMSNGYVQGAVSMSVSACSQVLPNSVKHSFFPEEKTLQTEVGHEEQEEQEEQVGANVHSM